MKIFPESNYFIELNNDYISYISELKNQTLSKEQFVTNWDNQTFLGEIKANEFEIKLSKKLFGELSVIKGKFKDKTGTLEIQTGKVFRIIFIAVVLFSFSGIITAIVQNKPELIFQIIMAILIIRFIFLELGFKLVSKNAINKLTKILRIKKIDKKV